MSLTPHSPPPRDHASLLAENDELRLRLREMEETLEAVYGGDVDALVVNNDVFLLESAGIAGNRLRHDVLGQMLDSVFAFDNEDHLIFLNPEAELRYGLDASDALGRSKPACLPKCRTAMNCRTRLFRKADAWASPPPSAPT